MSWRRFWIWLKVQAWKLMVPTGVRAWFSRLMWPILDRNRSDVVECRSPWDMSELVAGVEYRSDPLWGGFDRNRHPGAIQADVDACRGVAVPIGDCDDFAIWLAAKLDPGVHNPLLLSVAWVVDGGTFRGHQVCMFRWDGRFHHVGNYDGGRVFGPYDTVGELVEAMVDWRDGFGVRRHVVGWAAFTRDLARRVQRRVF